MASPEQLARRMDRAEEDLTALSDTLLDIRDTVHGHTTTLAEHGRALGEIQQEQDRQAAKLDEIATGLAAILRRLGEG
ncbi:hypothetical protein [Prauserella muralis]|nr:hypothetical protein [Prauserella muralis]TWE11126.1 hypothetical protein FHX69_7345 [Prauserella muralis]